MLALPKSQGDETTRTTSNEECPNDGTCKIDNKQLGLVENTMSVAHSPTCSSKEPITPSDASINQTTPHTQRASLDPENSIESAGAGSTGAKEEEKFETVSEMEACALFGRWVEASDHEEWKSVEVITYFAGDK